MRKTTSVFSTKRRGKKRHISKGYLPVVITKLQSKFMPQDRISHA